MDAVADRDPATEFCFAAALCGVHLSRLAEDMVLWSSAEFGFARMPDEFSTGSSLMPQKRNPDSMELLRGKAARFQASLTHLLTLTKGLPLTYNRDLQDDKPPLFDAADQPSAMKRVARNSLDYYSYRLIGKLTAFLQLQEFILRNIPVEDTSLLSAAPS